MPSELLYKDRVVLSESAFAEIVIWSVHPPVLGSWHAFKYRLVLVRNNQCVLRYDNESGKGDHIHVNGREKKYTFMSIEDLLHDFWADVDNWGD